MQSLVKNYKHTPVLVVGGRGDSCRTVAEKYVMIHPIELISVTRVITRYPTSS